MPCSPTLPLLLPLKKLSLPSKLEIRQRQTETAWQLILDPLL
jgi:hypothetical protein